MEYILRIYLFIVMKYNIYIYLFKMHIFVIKHATQFDYLGWYFNRLVYLLIWLFFLALPGDALKGNEDDTA